VQNGQVDVFADYSDYISDNYTYTLSGKTEWDHFRLDGSASYGKSDSKVTDLPP